MPLLSLFNLKQNDDYGVFEVGMDKKGEIDNLTKIIKPDLAIITNISYAHSKNFNSINQIADAKARDYESYKPYGTIILNADDEFYIYHKKIAHKKKLNILSFGIKNKFSFVKLVSAKKINMNKYLLSIKIGKSLYSFYSK